MSIEPGVGPKLCWAWPPEQTEIWILRSEAVVFQQRQEDHLPQESSLSPVSGHPQTLPEAFSAGVGWSEDGRLPNWF